MTRTTFAAIATAVVIAFALFRIATRRRRPKRLYTVMVWRGRYRA